MKNIVLKSLVVGVVCCLFLALSADAAPKIPALLLDGQNNHNWKETTPVMKKALEETGLFTVDVDTSPPEGGDMRLFKPGFSRYPVVVDNYNGDTWMPEVKQAFVEYVRQGGGLVVVHATDNAFGDWKEFNEMIGLGGWGGRNESSGPYVRFRDGKVVAEQKPGPAGSHGRQHAFPVTVRIPEHPITKGLPPVWMHTRDELYDSLRGPAQNMEVLATAYSDPVMRGSGEHEPALFTIAYGKGRVFHTVLGHGGAAMSCAGFLETFTRGTEWAATGKVTQAVPADFPTADRESLRVGLDDRPAPTGSGPLDACNVVWTTPSENSHGSMPLGNGDIGLNVWMEKNGDLLFYMGKSDAWSDTVRLLKLGRVRVRFTPNPFASADDFRQELKFPQGEIVVSAGDTKVRVWVDAHHPIIRVEAEAGKEFAAAATLETWRNKERTLEKGEEDSASATAVGLGPLVELPDIIHEDNETQTVWYHRNTKSSWTGTMQLQGLQDFAAQASDPLINRTFGGALEKSIGKKTWHLISVYLHTQQTPSVEAWLSRLGEIKAKGDRTDLESARRAHQRWWYEFWNRSWIRIGGAPDAAPVTFGYTAQRFLNACTGRGAYPIKFNGATLTVDARPGAQGHIKGAYNADYRSWGGGYWFQNTRLIYWPMLESGDGDLMRPLFNMYMDALPLARARTKTYFGHEGACFPETMTFWGAYLNENYGRDRTGKAASVVDNLYIRHYWQGGLELSAMMLDYYAFTEDVDFLRHTLLPFSGEILAFYDKHYPRDAAGKLVMEPAQSLETWWVATNPLPDVAGLQYVLDRLLQVSAGPVTPEHRALWTRLRGELPAIPLRETEKGKALSPAERYTDDAKNSENAELYAIFPYKIFGVNKPDLALANRSFDARRVKQAYCWHQDDAELALLGRAGEARDLVAKRFQRKDEGSRFPGFWGPNNDYTPDFDHGGEGQVALHAMLAQYDGDKILLFPAWPKEWDVEFKLQAPKNTVIEGVYRQGKLEKLSVTPAAREKDVVKLDPQ